MARKRIRALIYFNRGLGLAFIEDQPLFQYWFYTIQNILISGPLSTLALIQVPILFQATTVHFYTLPETIFHNISQAARPNVYLICQLVDRTDITLNQPSAKGCQLADTKQNNLLANQEKHDYIV